VRQWCGKAVVRIIGVLALHELRGSWWAKIHRIKVIVIT